MILLSFDVEEFDLPFEYGKPISFNEQISISTIGTLVVLDLLKQMDIKATFYCTANYAKNSPETILKMVNDGHEIASHGYYHSGFESKHLQESKEVLETISNTTVNGFRMARMMPVDEKEIAAAGYQYNSSINPTWLPGRYNNFSKPRTWFYRDSVLQFPSSVSPIIRFPLFWLTFHVLPLPLIKWLCTQTLKKDGYLNLYFHPWEFTNLNQPEHLGIPKYIANKSGEQYVELLKEFILWCKSENYSFMRTNDFLKTMVPNYVEFSPR
jgi:peptidoglycan/xylan/chitin deacetylase (PgdA/CDA1 family)